MSTHVDTRGAMRRDTLPPEIQVHHESRQLLAPLGRALYAAIFIVSSLGMFSSKTIGYAASAGVPAPQLLVPVAGVLALAGGLSVLLGYKTRWGALALVVFLVPVTLWMHRFWGLGDAQAAMMQRVNFMKNVALLGGALLLAWFGAGPVSLDARPGHGEAAEPS